MAAWAFWPKRGCLRRKRPLHAACPEENVSDQKGGGPSSCHPSDPHRDSSTAHSGLITASSTAMPAAQAICNPASTPSPALDNSVIDAGISASTMPAVSSAGNSAPQTSADQAAGEPVPAQPLMGSNQTVFASIPPQALLQKASSGQLPGGAAAAGRTGELDTFITQSQIPSASGMQPTTARYDRVPLPWHWAGCAPLSSLSRDLRCVHAAMACQTWVLAVAWLQMQRHCWWRRPRCTLPARVAPSFLLLQHGGG